MNRINNLLKYLHKHSFSEEYLYLKKISMKPGYIELTKEYSAGNLYLDNIFGSSKRLILPLPFQYSTEDPDIIKYNQLKYFINYLGFSLSGDFYVKVNRGNLKIGKFLKLILKVIDYKDVFIKKLKGEELKGEELREIKAFEEFLLEALMRNLSIRNLYKMRIKYPTEKLEVFEEGIRLLNEVKSAVSINTEQFKEKIKSYINEWPKIRSRITISLSENNLYMIISRDLIDVVRAGDNLISCHSPPEKFAMGPHQEFHCMVNDAAQGGMIAYLLTMSEINKIFGSMDVNQSSLDAMNGREIFIDDDEEKLDISKQRRTYRGNTMKGLPIFRKRIRIFEFINDPEHLEHFEDEEIEKYFGGETSEYYEVITIGIPMGKSYPSKNYHGGFISFLDDFLKNSQSEEINKIKDSSFRFDIGSTKYDHGFEKEIERFIGRRTAENIVDHSLEMGSSPPLADERDEKHSDRERTEEEIRTRIHEIYDRTILEQIENKLKEIEEQLLKKLIKFTFNIESFGDNNKEIKFNFELNFDFKIQFKDSLDEDRQVYLVRTLRSILKNILYHSISKNLKTYSMASNTEKRERLIGGEPPSNEDYGSDGWTNDVSESFSYISQSNLIKMKLFAEINSEYYGSIEDEDDMNIMINLIKKDLNDNSKIYSQLDKLIKDNILLFSNGHLKFEEFGMDLSRRLNTLLEDNEIIKIEITKANSSF